jgi:hypothetical protein
MENGLFCMTWGEEILKKFAESRIIAVRGSNVPFTLRRIYIK